jgi:D-psicose/D-tagatose/L-ribulose 3-epimerase
MAHRFKQAICNEVYEKRPLREVCRSIREIGYDGIEIAPFTLADRPSDIGAAQRREYRDTIRSEGLGYVGLHWLMVSPKGLHVTTPDRELRARSWRHIDDLIDLCADLGDNGIMVFGSPVQRGTTGGISRADAMKNYAEGLVGVAIHAAQRGVTILVEALPKNQCDVINTLDEAAGIVKQIGSPAVRTMFDTHNAVDEVEPHATLVDRHFDLIRHVHINEMDGRYPGTGDYDFKPVFEVLRRRGYERWVSLEVFDFKPGPERIASDSLRFIAGEIAKIDA